MSEGNVDKILLAADGPDKHRYCIVLCADGKYAITRNGHVIADRIWPSAQLHQCTRCFLTLAGLDGQMGCS
jgi:hypothetical protein